jgi:molybdate transport repressor ModE-like protein
MSTLTALDPKRLLILRVVAQLGSISGAARSLGWTPPAVSQHLAALENSLGVPLIIRHRSGVELTRAAKILVDHADVIARELDAALEEIHALDRRQRGAVRLGCFATSLVGLIPAVLKDLGPEDSAKVEVSIAEASPRDAVPLLQSGQLDVAIVYDFEDPQGQADIETLLNPLPPDLAARDIGGDGIVVIMSSDHPAAGRREVALADLAESSWITGCPHCRAHVERCCAAAGFTPHVTHQTHDSYVIKALIASDPTAMTVSAAPAMTVGSYTAPDFVVRDVAEMTGRQFFAVYRLRGDEDPTVAMLLDALDRVGRQATATAASRLVTGLRSSGR